MSGTSLMFVMLQIALLVEEQNENVLDPKEVAIIRSKSDLKFKLLVMAINKLVTQLSLVIS